MGKRRMKLSAEERVMVVEKVLNREIGLKQAAKEVGVDPVTILDWNAIYENEGPTGLLAAKTNKCYSKELKLEAVLDYLNGTDSLRTVAKRYKLRSRTQLRDWIKRYNTHGDFKSESGGSKVSQTKKFSLEDRVEMVLYCIANNYDYSETAVKYQVKYTNLYNWVKRYEEKGKAGLEDRRGQRKAKQESRTPEEEAQIRIAQLEEQVKYQQMEIDLLKKVKELERRDR
ncbi:helix-turn-helix domain-containing protein [Enterococcus raffinosus]|uniref:helix-turn-helix domain-containing protein n=1 Tax=Enterococcus raffinosus TaxID=71452 RepID=UPI001C0FEB60|nr:helix-turn-helix domain-containing protein [Enterococcus raffinosus]MBU5362152.1 helix-turn-helix domain-containing protein [Enterococcus raffinosus]